MNERKNNLIIQEQRFLHSNVEGYWTEVEEFYPSPEITPSNDLLPEGGK